METAPHPSPAATDRELIARYLERRDESAFRALYRAHTPYLYALAYRLLGGAGAEAEDAIQEAWVRAAARLAAFDGRSALRTWLAGIVVNCCREQRRRAAVRRVEELPEEPPAASSGGSPDVAGHARVDLERALRELPDEQRRILVLFDLAGYSHQEIHGLLGIAEGTSKSRLFAARRALRARLAAEPGALRGNAR